MRLLLYAGAGFSPIITTSASEPLLAEAACRLMIRCRWLGGNARNAKSRARLDPLVATTHYLGNSLLDVGERGEFATALLLLYARDRATTFVLEKSQSPGSSSSSDDNSSAKYDGAFQRRIVTVRQFLEALLGKDKSEICAASFVHHTPEFATTPLRTAFQEAFIYFNHFIKVQSYDVVHQAYLLLAISRGAPIICTNGHVGIDIVLIGTSLKKENVTAKLLKLIRDARDVSAQKDWRESVQRALRQMQPLVSTNREHTELFADLAADMGEYALAEDAGEDVVE